MRELKFRAFDHIDSVMLFADIYEMQDIQGEWTAWDLPKDSPTNTGTPFDIMQFTGLQDKNGVDIYEGDLIYATANNSYYTVCSGEYEISSHYDSSPHECVGFYLSRYNGLTFNECESIGGDCDYLEVIGNIHENPELLK